MTAPTLGGEAARSAHILAVLARHGFEVLDREVRLHAQRDETAAVQLREALEELGPVFTKLGQFVASQSAALSEPYRVELAKLDDDVPPVPTAQIRQVIEQALKAPTSELFATFDDTPVGTASIGQVHGATLHDGSAVVLKVKKPDANALVTVDLAILQTLVQRLTPHVALLRDMRADALLPAFVRTLRAELDYAAEAANLRMFAAHFDDDPGIAIPSLVADRTAGPVICEQRLSGPPLLKAAAAHAQDAAFGARAAELVVWLVLEPGLTTGVFHADPHAGNLLWTDDGRLGVIDFGKVGRLSAAQRRLVLSAFLALAGRSSERLATALLQLATVERPVDRVALAADVDVLLHRYGGAAVGGIDFRAGLSDLLRLLRDHGLSAPGDVVLFFKALAMSEGLVRQLTPGAHFTGLLAPVLRRVLLRQVTHGHALAGLAGWAFDAGGALVGLPVQAQRALAALNRGELRVWTQVEGLDPALSRMEAMVDRLTAAVLVAAAIIGTAVVLQVYRPPLHVGVDAVAWVLLGIVISFAVRALGRRFGRRAAKL